MTDRWVRTLPSVCVFVAAGVVVFLVGCYGALLTDYSGGLASGPGTDPVLDVTVRDGELEFIAGSDSAILRTGDVTTGGDHVRLSSGGVLDFGDVLNYRARGVTIAFRVRAVVSDPPPEYEDVPRSCLIAFLYRPGSPERLSSVFGFGSTVSADDPGNENYDVAGWRVVNGACDPQDETDDESIHPYDRCRIPTARATAGDAVAERGLDPSDWRWVVFTIDRHSLVQFLLEGTSVRESVFRTGGWSSGSGFDHSFGRLAFVTSTSCAYEYSGWGADQEFDPVNHRNEYSAGHPSHVFDVDAVRVFDYALTRSQMESLPTP